MIKTMEQAVKIQQTRANLQRRGYSKAVRRYLLANHRTMYIETKASLPVYW